MRFTIDDKRLIKWIGVKKITQKNACSRCFWQKMKSWWSKDTADQNIRARSLTLLICAAGGHCVVDHNPNTSQWCTDATAVTFSVKCFNPLKLYPLSGNIFRKWLTSYFLLIYQHLIIMWSPTVNLIVFTTLLLMPVYIAASEEYLRRIRITLCC